MIKFSYEKEVVTQFAVSMPKTVEEYALVFSPDV